MSSSPKPQNQQIDEEKTTMPPPPPPPPLPYIKRYRLFLEPSLGITTSTFLLVSICVMVSCFFYLDYRAVIKGFRFSSSSSSYSSGQSERFMWLKNEKEIAERIDFLNCTSGNNGCDVFDGDWVWDETYPLYQSKDCLFMDDGFRCSENGRPDLFYTKWRWQPKYCNLPRFDAKLMLEKLRNKRLVFVGDSIGRNQWESLLCMLSSAVSSKDAIYEVNGNPITKHKGFLIFKFKTYNCTVEYYRAPFLVLQSRPPSGSPKKIRTTLKLDKMDWTSLKWRDADVLVFNTGHWWNYEKTIRGGCYFQEGDAVKMDMEVESAYRRSMETVVDWIYNEVNTSKTQVFFRTFAPVHFRGGDWRTGGNCHLETLPDLGSSLVPPQTWSQFKIVTDVISSSSARYNNKSDGLKLDLLNVTSMTSRRKDGHSSLYYLGPNAAPAALHRQDCSHWCLPGVPDAWNEILYAFFLKRENTRSLNSSISQAQM